MKATLAFTAITAVALQFFYQTSLPEKIAIHFNFQGEADGWVHNSTGLFISSFLYVFIFLFFFFFEKILSRIPQRWINLPGKDDGSSHAKAHPRIQTISGYISFIGIVTLLFLAYIAHLVYLANRTGLQQLNNMALYLGLVGFLILITLSVLMLTHRVSNPRKPQ